MEPALGSKKLRQYKMEQLDPVRIVMSCVFAMTLVIFLTGFTIGISQLQPVVDITIHLEMDGYHLRWFDPLNQGFYMVDYILSVRGRLQPRRRDIVTGTSLLLRYKDQPLTPADDPSMIRGIIIARQANKIDSVPRYFDLPFPSESQSIER